MTRLWRTLLLLLVSLIALWGCLAVDQAGGGGPALPPCGTATPVATVWEVTPFSTPTPLVGGPRDFLEARFTPASRMRLRSAPSTAAATVLFLAAGRAVPVLREVFPQGAAWLRVIAPNGAEGWVAYRIGAITFGELEILQP